MNSNKFILFLLLINWFAANVYSQEIDELSPIEKSGFKKSTSYYDVAAYLDNLAPSYTGIEVKVIGKSAQGRKIQMIHVVPDKSSKNIKVLLICQQHGNEPSGKEVSMLLLQKICSGLEDKIISNIDLYVIPLVNPDGNEAGKRMNANGEDLNRNHLIMTQPEVIAVQNAYRDIDPDVTLDIHEYSAFRKEFRNAGYVRTDDEEFGAPTNPNISLRMRDYALNQFFPYLKSELAKKGISFSNYYKMNSPDDTVRASTLAIDDGRQSLAILGSFSFILEGRDGRNMNDDLKRRVTRQLFGVEKFLEFINYNSESIKTLVADEKKRMKESTDSVSVLMDYVSDGSKIGMPMQMLVTGVDTIMQLPYASTVKVMESVSRPQAYIIPKDEDDIIKLLDRHNISYITTKQVHTYQVEIYSVTDIKNEWLENKLFSLPTLSVNKQLITTQPGDIIVPLDQRAGTMIVIALEPASMWGICQFSEFSSLCKKGSNYPIIRIPEFKGTGND